MNQITISSDSDSDASMFASSTTTNRRQNPPQTYSHHHHHHHHHTHHPTLPTSTSSPNTSATEKRKSTTHRTHETIHLTNTILSSKELLLLHSLAANESVPRTRRRFWAQIIEPDDSVRAGEVVCDRLRETATTTTTGSGAGGGETAVGGLQVAPSNIIVDVVEMDDGNGWERLRTREATGGSSPMARKTSSPGEAAKKGQQQRVVSGSRSASRSGSPLASPIVRRRGRRDDGDGDVDMDIY